jgi:Holliday junction resolvase RusA-like endonuclease
MNELHFVIPGEPFAKQSMRVAATKNKVGKTIIRKYKSKKVEKAESYFRVSALQQLPNGFTPFNEPLEVRAMFVFPPLKTFSKTKMRQLENGDVIYKHTKPDLTDNLMKGVFDALESIVYVNDSLIAKTQATKRYGLNPQTEIYIKPIYAQTKGLF